MNKNFTTKPCPSCGTPSSGHFCENCGAPLSNAKCSKCGTELTTGGKFCANCAQPVGSSGGYNRAPSQPFAWVFAGIVIVAVVIVGVSSMPSAPQGNGVTAPQTVAPPQTMRGLADQYFDQAMRAAEAGDTVFFQSNAQLALTAYRTIELDADGQYHVGLLHGANSDADSVLVWADAILANTPTHLFGQMLRHDVSQSTGDQDMSRAAYADFLANYNTEIAINRPEYQSHRTLIDRFRSEAQAAQ